MFPDLFRDDVFRIETRRLWLRWPAARDAERIVRLAGERAVTEVTAPIPHPDRRAVDAFLLEARAGNAAGASLTLALCERSRPGCLIGIAAIACDPASAPQLGYWLARAYWGSGLMSEATGALVHAWFAWAAGTQLDSSVRTIDPAGRRVLEKSGFVRIGRDRPDLAARGSEAEVDRFRLERVGWAARAAGSGGPAALH